MFEKILIIQTAFAGDVILTLSLVQVLKKHYPESKIYFLCIPATSDLLINNPLIEEAIIYDKRGKDRGLLNFKKLIKRIKGYSFNLVISPHRSIKSTLLSYRSGCPFTISFNTSALSSKYTNRVEYKKGVHEIVRNLHLLTPLKIYENEIIKPELFISESDKVKVDELLNNFKIKESDKFITIAPGSVWFTKTFPEKKFTKLLNILSEFKFKVVFIGGKNDEGLCGKIIVESKNLDSYNAAGKLTLLQSAEIIRRSILLLTNDSAPLHLANAVNTRVLAIFGATVPEFGFYPYNADDFIFEVNNLKCRPCRIHGGNKCPVKTLDCLKKINEYDIADKIIQSF